jgi:hypothetical protein
MSSKQGSRASGMRTSASAASRRNCITSQRAVENEVAV